MATRSAVAVVKKPGILLTYTLRLDGTQTMATILLPGGVNFALGPLPIPLSTIKSLHVMYYPDRFLQVLIFGARGGPEHLQIPIHELPPHTTL